MGDWQDAEAVRFMLDDCQTWAVVGLSGNPSRTADAGMPMVMDTWPAIEWLKRE